MLLTLNAVANRPSSVTYEVSLRDGKTVTFRPLEHADVDGLTFFLEGLSAESRRLSTFDGYDHQTALELCDAINRYDKLRFVVEIPDTRIIVGLIELSFGMPSGDVERYSHAGIDLKEGTDCRFGPTLADAYQSMGLGTSVFPAIIDVLKKFGIKRLILWGGVLSDNVRAIGYYEKLGFKHVGEFVGTTGHPSLDMILQIK